jgi:hypothetical protein
MPEVMPASSEQVRIRHRIPAHTVVCRTGDREHRADERGEHDAWRAHLPEDRLVDGAQRIGRVQGVKMREDRARDRVRADCRGADGESQEQ